MPFSSDENRDWVLSQIRPQDRVLDVGAGAGIFADLLAHRVAQIDAVEIFTPYIAEYDLENKYNTVFNDDFRKIDIPLNSYDVVIMGDVLEHFELDDAMKVWEKARGIVGQKGRVIMSTPIIEWPQGEEFGNIHEAHLSFFKYEDLQALPGFYDGVEGEQIGSIVANGHSVTAKDLTLVITTIPTRTERLQIALESVNNQTLYPTEVIIQCDTERLGAPGNRDKGLAQVKTKWVAFLDDDDYFYPEHLELLYHAAVEEDADLVYSWFNVDGGTDPFPENFGKPWDPKNPVQTTVTTLGKADSYREAGGFSNTYGLDEEQLATFAQGNTIGEDFRLVMQMNDLEKKIVHVPKKTWAYVHWENNTSGMPTRW